MIDPAYYENMSTLLNEIIKERKSKLTKRKDYLFMYFDKENFIHGNIGSKTIKIGVVLSSVILLIYILDLKSQIFQKYFN